jgi:ankyrin repeat protein
MMVNICRTFGVSADGALLYSDSDVKTSFIQVQPGRADLQIVNTDGSMRLIRAAENGHEDVIRLLLDCGVNLNAADNNDNRPLHVAAGIGHEGVARLLLNHGADLNIANKIARHRFI